MKTKLKLALLCLALSNISVFAQQKNNESGDLKITITKKVIGADGSTASETIVKKGKSAQNFDIDAYIKENKANNVDLDIRSEGGDEERYISIHGSEGPQNNRFKSIEEDVTDEVNRTLTWVNDQVRIINDRMPYNSKGFLGVDEDSDEKADEEGIVVAIIRNSAADQAGLRDNDIILRLNGTKTNKWSDLTSFMQDAQKGDVVKIVYRRNGADAETEAVLTTRAEVKPVDCSQEQPRGFLGVCDFSNDEDNKNGARVSIVKKSAADKAGLKDGDYILKLNDTPIQDFEDIEDFMKYIHPGNNIKVNYERDGNTNTIDVIAGKEASWDWGQIDWKLNDINIRTKDACLGIYNGTVSNGSRKGANIVNFTNDSAAKMAGLQIGDIILSVEGMRVQNSDELWDELAKFKPKDIVKVEYARGDREFVADVTLGTCQEVSSMVKIYDADENGNSSERQFYASSMRGQDEMQLRERQTIAVHKGNLCDMPVINTTSGNESNPVMKERSLKLDYLKTSPNPSDGPLSVEFRAPSVPTVVTLYDLSGHQLFQEELNVFGGRYVQQFDLDEFSKSGVLLRIQQGDKFYSEQILIN